MVREIRGGRKLREQIRYIKPCGVLHSIFMHSIRRSIRLTTKMLLPVTTLTALCMLFDFSKSTNMEELEDTFKAR